MKKASGNGRHDPAAQSIYGDAVIFNRVQRLMAQVLDRRLEAQRLRGGGSGSIVANAPFTARAAWLESGGEDDLDPRRSIWDECGYPSTRTMTPQRWQTLHDRDAIACTVNEAMARYAWQVTPEVFEREQGKVVTAFDKGWKELGRQLRFGGMPDHFGEVGGGPIEEVLERANALSGIGRFGVIVYGLDDGLGWDKPVPGIVEQGSKPGEMKIDAEGRPLTDGQGQPVLNVDRGDAKRWSLTRNAALTAGRRLGYMNTFPESMIRPNRFETSKDSPRFGRPVSYQITFQDPRNPIWGVGLPLTTQQVHWTRVQHIADTVDTYGSSTVFAVPRCQPVLNNIMALSKLYHGAAEGFWKFALPYLFLTTHPQLGGDVDVDDEGLKDMVEEMMNGLQKAGVMSGMDAKMVGGSFADPSTQINAHLEAIAMKKRMPVRILKGSERGELSSAQDDDSWDDQVVRYQTGYCTNGLIRPCVNLMIWYGVVPPPATPGALKVRWPDVTSMSAIQKAQVAGARMSALSTYLNGGGGNALTLFDFFVNEWNYTQEQALAAIKNAAKANGYDLAQTGIPDQIDTPQEEQAIEDWTPPEAVGNAWTDDEDDEELLMNCGGEGGTPGPCPEGGGSVPGGTKSAAGVVPNHVQKAYDDAKSEHESSRRAAIKAHGTTDFDAAKAKLSDAAFRLSKARSDYERSGHVGNQRVADNLEDLALNCGGEGGTPGPCPEAGASDAMAAEHEARADVAVKTGDDAGYKAATGLAIKYRAEAKETRTDKKKSQDSLTIRVPDNGMKPSGNVKFNRGSHGEAVTAAARLSAFHGKPAHVYATAGGFKVTTDRPKLPPGNSSIEISATHDGTHYTASKKVNNGLSMTAEAEPGAAEPTGNAWTDEARAAALEARRAAMVGAVRGADKIWRDGKGVAAPDHIQKLGIPPAWRDVQVNHDPDGDLMVRGVDAKGRTQMRYSASHNSRAAAAKFGRVAELRAKRQQIFKEVDRDAKDPAMKENAECLKVIMQTGIRPGSDTDTKAAHESFGATTIQGRHVIANADGTATLKFSPGKHQGRKVQFPVRDKATAAMLIARSQAAGRTGKVFNTSASALRDYSKAKDGGGFKTKDHRTALGTETAIAAINERAEPPKNMKEYKAAVKDVATQVAATLGNTPSIALKSYIDPSVFSHWKPKGVIS